MAYRSARLASILAGTAALAGISAGLAAEVGAPPKTDAHANWKLIEENCFKCHNTDDWAGSVAFDTMTVDSITDEGKVWEATIKKLKGGLMPPAGRKAAGRGGNGQARLLA